MTAPREYKWVSTWQRTNGEAAAMTFSVLVGPGTVRRIIGDVTWSSASGVFGGFQDFAWGLSYGTASANVTAPNTVGYDWAIHRVVGQPVPAGEVETGPVAPQHIDISSNRVLADATEHLWFSASRFGGGPTFNWYAAFRVLIELPAA